MKLVEKFIMAAMMAIAVFFAYATIQSASNKFVWQPTTLVTGDKQYN